MFKACFASWMLKHWNIALNMCLRYADSSVLIDFSSIKFFQTEKRIRKLFLGDSYLFQ